jgi:hypothetical protein
MEGRLGGQHVTVTELPQGIEAMTLESGIPIGYENNMRNL